MAKEKQLLEEKISEARRIDSSANNVTKDSISSDSSYKLIEYVNDLNNKVIAYLEQISKITCIPYKTYSFSYSNKGPDMRYMQKRLSFNLNQALNPEGISTAIVNSISLIFTGLIAKIESIALIRKSGGIEQKSEQSELHHY